MQTIRPTSKYPGCKGLCRDANMRYGPDGIHTVCRVCRTQRIFTNGTMADYKKMFPSEFLAPKDRKKLNPKNKLQRFRFRGVQTSSVRNKIQ
jgi:hypothetical protein